MIELPQGAAFAIIAGYRRSTIYTRPWFPPLLPHCLAPADIWYPAQPLLYLHRLIIWPNGSPEFIRLALTLTFLTGLFQLILGPVLPDGEPWPAASRNTHKD